jgi:extradiol dioxygenase
VKVVSLGYLGFRSPNYKEWESFGPEVFGLGLAEPGPDGTVYLRMDDRHHRVAVHPGEQDEIAYMGWELRGKAAFVEACRELEAHGLEYRLGTREECQERKVAAFAQFTDPADYTHEVFYGQVFTAGSFQPSKPSSGFVADHHGVGHCVVVVPEFTDELEHFATEVLGFQLFAGYTAPTPDGKLAGPQFYRCNPRTHCFAYIAIPGLRGVQHWCLEANSLDDVGKAYDIVQSREDIPITMSLGRHMLDSLVSFYLRTPTGFDMEFGAGGDALADDYVQLNPSNPEVWGHKFVTQGWAPTVRPVAPKA